MTALWLIGFSAFIRAVISLQASDFYVHDLPLLPKESSSIRMHAGHLSVNLQHHGALFFWHFASKYLADKPRTVIWLGGGPGCSSLTTAWMAIGPFRFEDTSKMIENDQSWHLYTNLLFVDQPVGTGFSYTDMDSFVHELDEAANQFLSFLDRYIEIFPELLQNDIYLAGISYAGQSIPYIAQAILDKRSILKLRGLLIGNGWIDPASTYKSYLPFAVAKNLIEQNSELYNSINDKVQQCERALTKQVRVSEDNCDAILYQISQDGPMDKYYAKKHRSSCMNIYDVHLADTTSDCRLNRLPSAEYVTDYLHRQDVLSCIHVDGKKLRWTECSDTVFETFQACHSQPSVKLFPALLRQIPILLYSGEYDLICNHYGTETMIDTLTWNNRTGFTSNDGTVSSPAPWMVDGESVGLIQTARNLTYILFYNAGHIVHYDQTRRSRIMLHQFMQLDLSSTDKKSTKKSVDGVTQSTHRPSRRRHFIVLAIVITIIILVSVSWFFIHKRQQSDPSTPFNIIHLLRSKTSHMQQRVVYSLLNHSKEDVCAPNNSTLV